MRSWFLVWVCLMGCTATSLAQKKLSQVTLDSIEFSGSDLPSVLGFLGLKARELGAVPYNFVLVDPSGRMEADPPLIDLKLSKVPFSQAFSYVSRLSGTTYLIDPRVVWVGRADDLKLLKKRRDSRNPSFLGDSRFAGLKRIAVAEANFSDATLSEAVEFFRMMERGNGAPGNYVAVPPGQLKQDRDRLNFHLKNVTLAELIQYSADLAGARLDFVGNTIVFQDGYQSQRAAPPQGNSARLMAGRRIEQVSVKEATLSDIMDLIRYHASQSGSPIPVNLVGSSTTSKTISLDLRNVSLLEILTLTNELTQTGARTGPGGVIQIYDLPPRN